MNPTDIPRAPAYVPPTFMFTGTLLTEDLKRLGEFESDAQLQKWLDDNNALLRSQAEAGLRQSVRVVMATTGIKITNG